VNHSLVGDACSVLANCLSAGEKVDTSSKTKQPNDGNGSRYYWALAYSHYELVLKGWTKIESISHPNAAAAAYSVARCLRELGLIDQALTILEKLASCMQLKQDSREAAGRLKEGTTKKTNISTFPAGIIPLLPRRGNVQDFTSSPRFICQHEQSSVLCLWMIAILTIEQSPDERGRNRALSLLHTASLTLQRTLRNPDLDDQTRMVCLDLYDKVESEALDLFEPIEHLEIPEGRQDGTSPSDRGDNNVPSSTKSPVQNKIAKAPWEVLTPMRQQRQWTSPRKKRLAAVSSSKIKMDRMEKAVIEMV
jgi:hypothetical protein